MLFDLEQMAGLTLHIWQMRQQQQQYTLWQRWGKRQLCGSGHRNHKRKKEK